MKMDEDYVTCVECKKGVSSPGVAVRPAVKENGEVKIGDGYLACHSCYDSNIGGAYPLERMTDGKIIVLEEWDGRENGKGFIDNDANLEDGVRIGFLSCTDLSRRLPITHDKIYFPNKK